MAAGGIWHGRCGEVPAPGRRVLRRVPVPSWAGRSGAGRGTVSPAQGARATRGGGTAAGGCCNGLC